MGVLEEVQLVEKLSEYCANEVSSWRSKSTQLDPILNQYNLVHRVTFLSMDLNTFLPSPTTYSMCLFS
jgi:hypothetical protein